MSAETIVALSREAAVRAFAEELEPYVPEKGEVDRWNRIPITYLGSYNPAGWALQEHVLVDKSGFGSESEPALTEREFKVWVTQMQAQYDEPGFAIIEEGQFQVVVGCFILDDTVQGDTFEVGYCYNCGDAYEKGETEHCLSCGERVDGQAECLDCGNPTDLVELWDGYCKECLPFHPGDLVTWEGEKHGRVLAYDKDADTLIVLCMPSLEEVEIPFEGTGLDYNPLDDENQIQLPIEL